MTAAAGTGGTRRRPYWMPILVLGLGAGSVLLLLANKWIQESLIAPDIGSLRAVADIRTRVSVAHLWIEEYVTGDEVDLDEIDRNLESAERLTRALELRGAESSGDRALDWRPGNGGIESATAPVAAGARRFARLTQERRAAAEAGANVGIGSPVDIVYDSAFEQLHLDLDRLERALILRLNESERRAALLFRGLLVAWSLIVVLAAAALWARERRQLATETALGDSQAQLLQAQKMEAVGRLAGGLAHDINNYLAAISAQSELVKMREEPDSPTARRMEAILGTTERASALIERLLAFSRRQPARPQPLYVNRVLEDLESMLRQLLGTDIELRLELDPNLWAVEMDVSQLEQIVLNLAVNAREAMASGGTLTLATRNRKAAAQMGGGDRSEAVALTVTDTGPGIPEALRRKIFEPFFTTKEKTHSGLGLATVLGVVEQNGGRIKFDSNESGTRFEVLLPRGDREPAESPNRTAAAEPPSGNSERILLVEDNDEVRRSTRDLLTSWGYAVTAVSGGREALEACARESDFDLLITDVVMPGMSGREVAEAARAIQPDLPVLYISGNTDDGVLRHGLEAGSVDLLPKPFTALALAQRVQRALGQEQRVGAAS